MRSLRYILFMFLLLSSCYVRALPLLPDDPATVEALIDDHKRVRAVLKARSALEQVNVVLHDFSKAANVRYDSVNINLDKYQKVFDFIDIAYTSLATCANAYNTYNEVTDRVGKLTDLLGDFKSQFEKNHKLLVSDTIIIFTCVQTLGQVRLVTGNLLLCIAELGFYMSGVYKITTADFLVLMNHMNESFDHLSGALDHAYFVLHRYMMIRSHWWNKSLYRAKSKGVILRESLERWNKASYGGSYGGR